MKNIYIEQLPKQVEEEHICVDPSYRTVVMGFWGNCHAVRLVHRGKDDNHICFEIMTNDDGHWFVSNGSASSSWLPELIELLSVANKWMQEHAIPDMHSGHQFGYKT